MAMINCPECGKEISDKSDKCIHCGYPLKAKPQRFGGIRIGIIVLSIAIVILLIVLVVGVIIVRNSMNNSSTSSEAAGEVCKVEGCDNPVYSNGYCIIHYGQVRNGEEVQTGGKSSSAPSQASGTAVEEDEVKAKSFSKNTKITASECEFTLTGYTIASKIEPSTSADYYHYYEAAAGNVFVDVKFSIKNTSGSAKAQDDVLRSVKLIYNDKYEYNCQYVTEENDGDFNGYPSIYSINPLETMKYHMLAEVPNEVKSSSGSLVVRVDSDGQLYECKLR